MSGARASDCGRRPAFVVGVGDGAVRRWPSTASALRSHCSTPDDVHDRERTRRGRRRRRRCASRIAWCSLQGAADGVLLGDAAPDAGAHRVARERVDEAREVAVARRVGDAAVELEVVLDQALDIVEPVDAASRLAQVRDPRSRRSLRRGEGGGGGLEDAAHGEDLEHRRVVVQVDDERHRLEQQLRFEARDVGAVAAAHVEHPDDLERLDRLAQRGLRERPSRSLSSFSGGRRSPGASSPERIISLILRIASSVTAMHPV